MELNSCSDVDVSGDFYFTVAINDQCDLIYINNRAGGTVENLRIHPNVTFEGLSSGDLPQSFVRVTASAVKNLYLGGTYRGGARRLAIVSSDTDGLFVGVKDALIWSDFDESEIYQAMISGDNQGPWARVVAGDIHLGAGEAQRLDQREDTGANFLLRGEGSEREIKSNGSIIVSHEVHLVRTRNAAANDNLDTLTQGEFRDVIALRAQSGETVTIRDGQGNIVTGTGNVTLPTDGTVYELIKGYDGNWRPV